MTQLLNIKLFREQNGDINVSTKLSFADTMTVLQKAQTALIMHNFIQDINDFAEDIFPDPLAPTDEDMANIAAYDEYNTDVFY
jgi:organic radical activating enzyme